MHAKRGNWVVPDIEETYSNNSISPKFKAIFTLMNVPTEMLCYFIVFFTKPTSLPPGLEPVTFRMLKITNGANGCSNGSNACANGANGYING